MTRPELMVSGQWIVLRCASSQTLRLADSLNEAGFEAWSPREIVTKRKGRDRVKVQIPKAVMPSYVFARASDLIDLVRTSKALSSPHPDFSLFRYYSRFPLIADATLDPLRIAERKGTPVQQAAPLNPGELVRYSEAGLQGLTGKVIRTRNKGKMVLVAFGTMQIEIASMLLLPAESQTERKAA